jgi:hypothetical protein
MQVLPVPDWVSRTPDSEMGVRAISVVRKKGGRLEVRIQNYLMYSIAKCSNNKKKEEDLNSVQRSGTLRS